jgi:hypothetical protein
MARECLRLGQKAKRKITQSTRLSRIFVFYSLPFIYYWGMGKKSAKIAERIEGYQGQQLDAHYLGFFDCFNQGLFYESHDVLEELWLAARKGPNDAFYRGLIQFAGAFVHLQKNRLKPAAALFDRARANLQKYPGVHERLDVSKLLGVIDSWRGGLEATGFSANPLTAIGAPKLTLTEPL